MLGYLEKQAQQSDADIKCANSNNRKKACRLLNYLLVGIGYSETYLANR